MSDDLVIIHARFAPNGTIVEISERPPSLTPQEWFDFLALKVGETSYQALSGGRGIYRVARAELDALKAEAAPSAAA